MNKKNNDKLVVQDNLFIESKQNFTLLEAKLFAKVLSCISKDHNFNNGYIFKISDLLNSFNMHEKDHKFVIKTAESLRMKKPKVRTIDGKKINTGYFTHFVHDINPTFLEIYLCDKLKPYLLNLKEHFTSYQLENIVKLKSVNSFKSYEFLKQVEFMKEKTISVAEIKTLLGLENKYNLYRDFKKKVILRAQTELKEKTDISFDFEEIKTGRAITHIKFIIHQQRQQLTTGASRPQQERPTTAPQNPLMQRLISLGFNEQQTKEIIKQQTPEFITTNADILEELQRQGRINTNIPAFSKGFTKDFRQTKSAHEIDQEARQEQSKAEAERIAKAKAEQAKADDLGKTIYNKSLETYTEIFFSNTEQNSEFIKDFENRYIKTGVGAMLFKKRPETAKTAFIQTNKQIDINTEVIKIAESAGYILTFDGIQWQAVEDNQEKLFPID